MTEYDAPPSSDSDGAPSTTSPSISKERWANFALAKLRDGYALMQSPNGLAYQFYRVGEPLQPCPAHAAKKLVAMGLLTVERMDVRGTRYVLRPAFQADAATA